MAQLFDIEKVTIGPRYLDAEVGLVGDAPTYTSDDPEGTRRVMDLLPELGDHLCLGDASGRFGEVVENTEVAHLLEHVTVELVARTGLGGRVSSGRTVQVARDRYALRFDCPDDVLVTAALSSAVWVLEWAYAGGGEPTPDVDSIVRGIEGLVASAGATPEDGVGQDGRDADAGDAPARQQDGPAEPAPVAPDRDDEDDEWTFETLGGTDEDE